LKRAQRELELGAISALEIFQPQAQYARAEIFVTQARYRLQQTEDVLRRQISIDLAPELRTLPIVLTESVLPPTDNTPFDRERLVTEALRNRPDLQAARTNLDVDEYGIKIASNNLRPDFGVTGTYSTQGIGGNTLLNNGSTLPGGFGDAWSQMWGFNYPIYGFGFQLRLPIKDRRAIADYADAVVAKRMDTFRVRSIEQQTRQDVLNAVSQVENSRASVDLAKIAADFAQKRVEADQKRYDLGTITLFFLISSQNDLTQAQSDLVNNSIQYRRNLLNLSQRTGSLLVDRGIVIK
jgi:outer membrane protein TolC